jgi:predicted CXXCH cytochrome family protein
MVIPAKFPLENGKIACRTCHTAHNVPGSANLSNIFFLRVANEKSELCQGCHAEKSTGPTHGSHPLGKSLAVPVDLIADGAKSGPKGAELICQSCHEAHGSKADKLLVRSVGDNALCISCHNQLQPGQWGQSGSHTHPVNVALSTDVQRQAIHDLGTHTGANQTLACLSCHRLHDAKTTSKLLADTQSGSQLCLRCHPDHATVEGTAHDLRKTAPTTRNSLGLTAEDSGPCSACHLPHQKARPPVIAAGDPAGECLSCHADGKLAATMIPVGANAPMGAMHFNHPEQVSKSKLPAGLTLAVYTGTDNTKANLTCQTCHNPHDATRAKFLRNTQDGLCASCHGDKAKSLAGAHDLTTRPSARNGLNQTAAESGKCGFCHDVHKGNGSLLWVATSKAPTNSNDLCTQCHKASGLASDHPAPAASHPGIVAGAGVSMPLPLFDAAGQRVEQNGMVQCASCHDPHSDSSKSHQLLRIAGSTPDQLCKTCHTEQAATLAGSHDFSTHLGERNGLGKTEAESGKCGFCHDVHKGSGSFLWAATKTTPKTAAELCTNCHQKDGIAAQHPAAAFSHPMGMKVSRVVPLPLFDAIGQRVEQKGMVECASCHNPHSDSTRQHQLLRVTGSPSELCVTCHADKAAIAGGKHDSRVNPAWPVSKEPVTNDLCLSCHKAHGNDEVQKLWTAAPEVSAVTPNEQRCLGCHNDQIAKRPEIPQHPTVVFALIGLAKGLPATQPTGPVALGGKYLPSEQSIPCGVCHEPHGAMSHEQAAGATTRPSVMDVELAGAARPTLRANVGQEICATCHGADAQRVLLYYHRSRQRQAVQDLQQPAGVGIVELAR